MASWLNEKGLARREKQAVQSARIYPGLINEKEGRWEKSRVNRGKQTLARPFDPIPF